MIKTIICDDNRDWLERAACILNGFAGQQGIDMEVAMCASPEEVPGCFDMAPDILFMDIEFDRPGEAAAVCGIEAVKEINSKYPGCHVVYLTNYLEYAVDVYDTDHTWYMLKEQFEDRLPALFRKIRRIEDSGRDELMIRDADGTQMVIKCGSIKFLERRDRKTIIRTDSGDHTVRQRIPEIESMLPAGSFGRCHTSYIVNLAKVSSIGGRSLRMDDGTEILISRGYGKTFRLKYMEWARERAVR